MLDNNWFTEKCQGAAVSVKVKEHLYSGKSDFQQIDVFDTETHGRMLVLDGIIQLTERDEFCYQEMMAHLPLFAHPDPRRVLVIGGGDGGVLREVAKHSCVEEIDHCEIDAEVVRVSKEFLPFTACGYDDPRVKLRIADGSEFVKKRPGYYDVIIVDSTDPEGPGEALFNERFYRGMKSALREGGIITSQSESFFLHMDIIRRLLGISAKIFERVGYAAIFIPTYPSGCIGACVASLGPDIRKPARKPEGGSFTSLRYYSPEIHEAAFRLPLFANKALADLVK